MLTAPLSFCSSGHSWQWPGFHAAVKHTELLKHSLHLSSSWLPWVDLPCPKRAVTTMNFLRITDWGNLADKPRQQHFLEVWLPRNKAFLYLNQNGQCLWQWRCHTSFWGSNSLSPAVPAMGPFFFGTLFGTGTHFTFPFLILPLAFQEHPQNSLQLGHELPKTEKKLQTSTRAMGDAVALISLLNRMHLKELFQRSCCECKMLWQNWVSAWGRKCTFCQHPGDSAAHKPARRELGFFSSPTRYCRSFLSSSPVNKLAVPWRWLISY